MSQSLPLTRMRLIALLIIAALSFSAVTALAVFNASPAGAAKKSKKCKKGYKKVKGKCRKKKRSGVIELPPAPAPPSVGGASASDAGIAAKRKSKKCKKGYKKVKGKCRKKKAASSATVSSITIDSFQPSAYRATLKGTITLKKPVTSLKVTVKCTRQGYTQTSDTTVASDGAALTISYTANVSPGCIRLPGRGDIDYYAIADGVSSKAY